MKEVALQLSCSLASKGTHVPVAAQPVALHSPRPLAPLSTRRPYGTNAPPHTFTPAQYLYIALQPRRLITPSADVPQLPRWHGDGCRPLQTEEPQVIPARETQQTCG